MFMTKMKNINKFCIAILIVILVGLSSCNSGMTDHHMRKKESLCCKPWKLILPNEAFSSL